MGNNYQGSYQGSYGGNQQNGQQRGSTNYTVDMVLCIDATGSMEDFSGNQQKIINMVKKNALSFYDDMIKKMELFGNDSKGLYSLDAEYAARVYTAPSLVV